MAEIKLSTIINAPIEVCFNLARSIDAHQSSTVQTKEKAVGGRTTGLIELGETVVWEAKHLGIKQRLSVKITKMEKPHFFEDEMQKGAFKSMMHKHEFKALADDKTLMKDVFNYTVPLGVIGSLFDMLVLKNYMTNFLKTRNTILKSTAENGEWRKYFSV